MALKNPWSMSKTNMLGNKTDALILSCKDRRVSHLPSHTAKKTSVGIMLAGVFLLPMFGCVMTKAQGEKLAGHVHHLEDEVAKLQRVRHDTEILLAKVRDIVDRIVRVEGQLAVLKESLSADST